VPCATKVKMRGEQNQVLMVWCMENYSMYEKKVAIDTHFDISFWVIFYFMHVVTVACGCEYLAKLFTNKHPLLLFPTKFYCLAILMAHCDDHKGVNHRQVHQVGETSTLLTQPGASGFFSCSSQQRRWWQASTSLAALSERNGEGSAKPFPLVTSWQPLTSGWALELVYWEREGDYVEKRPLKKFLDILQLSMHHAVRIWFCSPLVQLTWMKCHRHLIQEEPLSSNLQQRTHK